MASDHTQAPAPQDLGLNVPLSAGQMFYTDKNGKPRHCHFQFNPTEIERSRSVNTTRTPTGNVLEEPHYDGKRNHAKRKQSRKVDPWSMSLTLRFDASRPLVLPKVIPPPPKTATPSSSSQAPTGPATATATSTAAAAPQKPFVTDHVMHAMRFFESLAEPSPFTDENNRIINADETPPPPAVVLALGTRSWNCTVQQVRIKEQDFTFDLYPRRFEVTLTLEALETTRQNATDQTGGTR